VEYRGVEYQVVQTIGGGFRWSVQFGEQEKSGLLSRRDSAIMHVKSLIDGRAERDLRQTTPQTEVAAEESPGTNSSALSSSALTQPRSV